MKKIISIIFFILILKICSVSYGATVFFKDGSIAKGEILKETQTTVTIKKINGLVVEISKDKIKEIDNSLLFPFRKNCLWGYIDQTGKVIIKPKFAEAFYFTDDGLALVEAGYSQSCSENSNSFSTGEYFNFGYINKKGEYVIKPRQCKAVSFSEGMAAIELPSTGWVFIDKTGKIVTKNDYWDLPTDFKNGLSRVLVQIGKGGYWTYIDNKNNIKLKLPANIYFVESFSEGLAAVCINNKWGFIDKSGNFIIKPQFAYVNNFSEGLAFVQDKNYKYSVIDKTGKIIFNAFFIDSFYTITQFKDGFATAKLKDGQDVFINKSGKIAAKYEQIYIDWIQDDLSTTFTTENNSYVFSEGLSAVKSNGKWGYIDKNFSFVIKPQFDEAKLFHQGLAVVKLNNKCGYIDKTGKAVTDFIFLRCSNFKEDFARVKLLLKGAAKDDVTYIDKTGKVIAQIPYINNVMSTNDDEYSDFSEGLARTIIKRDGKNKFAYLDTSGKIAFELSEIYDRARGFSEGLAAVRESANYKWGYIDKTGNFIINSKFDDAGNFVNGLARACFDLEFYTFIGKKCGYINKNGNFITEVKYDYRMYPFSEGLSAVRVSEELRKAVINKTGKYVINPVYEDLGYLSEGLISAKKNNLWGYLDLKEQWIIKPQFEEASIFYNNLAVVKINNKYGFIDKSGKIIINPEFDDVNLCYENSCPVKKNNKWGYIDTSGKTIIEPQFDYTDYFSEGLANVFINKKWGYINKSGQYVVEPNFSYALPLSEKMGRFWIKDNKDETKYGFIDNNGKIVIEPKFDNAEDFYNGLAKVWSGKKFGYIDKNGNYVWQPTF